MTLYPGEFVVDRKTLIAASLGVSVLDLLPPTARGKCRSCGSTHYLNGVCAYCRTPA